MKVAASTVWEILQDAGIDPAPKRAASTWAGFLRSHAEALLAWTSKTRAAVHGS
jgi:putative transposase